MMRQQHQASSRPIRPGRTPKSSVNPFALPRRSAVQLQPASNPAGISFEDQRNDDDLVIERDGAAVLVDATSLELLKGSELDFVEEMVGSSFQVKNPNATSSCGCGNSFSV